MEILVCGTIHYGEEPCAIRVKLIVIIFFCDDYFAAIDFGRLMSISAWVVVSRDYWESLFLGESEELAVVQEKVQFLELRPVQVPVVGEIDLVRL